MIFNFNILIVSKILNKFNFVFHFANIEFSSIFFIATKTYNGNRRGHDPPRTVLGKKAMEWSRTQGHA